MKGFMKRVLSCMMIIIFLAVIVAGCGGQGTAKGWSGPSGIKIPWGDYEENIYALTIDSKATYDMKYIIEKMEQGGKSVYKMQVPFVITDGEHNSGTVMEADTLKPLSSFYLRHPPKESEDKKIDITGTYGEKLAVAAESSKGKQNWELKLSGECVDNGAVPMVIRALPLAEGFKKTINLVILSTVKVAPFEVRVVGKEKIKVPVGEFDCIKVELQYKGFMPAPALKFWYSADDRKIMVKSIQGTTVFELKEFKDKK